MKSFKKMFPWLLAFGAFAGVYFLYAANAPKETELARLKPESQELQSLRTENEELKKVQVQGDELARLRKDNADMPRLRNEIHQLREENATLI